MHSYVRQARMDWLEDRKRNKVCTCRGQLLNLDLLFTSIRLQYDPTANTMQILPAVNPNDARALNRDMSVPVR